MLFETLLVNQMHEIEENIVQLMKASVRIGKRI